MNNRDKKVLVKILDEIDIIISSTSDISLVAFLDNETLKRAMAMTLINIGELARLLSEDFKMSAPSIPFREIIATRNVAAHGYLTLKFEDIWSTIKEDIPFLRECVLSYV